MKIQGLAVIFILIVLPMSIILSEYFQAQINTINLQTSYDSKLISASYDAVKAFQLNAVNSSSNDISSSKIRDIEASASTFMTSMANNFGENGSSKNSIKSFIPALVYCLYDGYYIYTPYTNNIGNEIQNQMDEAVGTARSSGDNKFKNTYNDRETLTGLKPYIYYSCRYTLGMGDNTDFVITYSLDNFITIQGNIDGEYWNESGYYLDGVNMTGETVTYNGIEIPKEENILEEKIYDPEYNEIKTYQYTKISGTKYYYDDEPENIDSPVFYILNGEKSRGPSLNIKDKEYYVSRLGTNDNAYQFYKKAFEFKEKVQGNDTLRNIEFGNAVNENGQPIVDKENNAINGFFGDEKIFSEDVSGVLAEDSNSNFTEHRTAVIRYSIEKNLTTAIANYNQNYAGGTAAFAMPNLSETDWYKIINNVSLITFLQGMPIGGKEYNGYAVVTNNKNEDFVSSESIYMSDGNEYHTIDDSDLMNKGNLTGYVNLDFERHTDDQTNYYYPRSESGCYMSIVNQNGVNLQGEPNIEAYVKNKLAGSTSTNKKEIARAFYTALGRERYGMYRINAIDDIP